MGDEAGELVSRGLTLIYSERFNEALECFDQALRLSPHNADAWNNKGRTLSALGNSQQAQKCFSQAASLWFKAGLVNLEKDRLTEAFQCIERAYRASPNDVFDQAVSTLKHKGAQLRQLGRLGEAAQCFSKALELEQGSGDTL